MARLRTDAEGEWSRELAVGPRDQYRFAWRDVAGTTGGHSGVVRLALPGDGRLHAALP